MKKLMILAAIATVAISSQAANWTWHMGDSSLMYAYGSTSTDKTLFSSTTAKAYIFAYVDADSQKAVFNQWYNEGNYGVTTLTGAVTGRDGNPETKTFSDGQVTYDANMYEFKTADAQKKFFFALIDDQGHLFISGTRTGTVSNLDGGTLLSFSAETPSLRDNGAATAYGSTGWYKQASGDVPEPTSAMLMLLGVAGLALRRRRA